MQREIARETEEQRRPWGETPGEHLRMTGEKRPRRADWGDPERDPRGFYMRRQDPRRRDLRGGETKGEGRPGGDLREETGGDTRARDRGAATWGRDPWEGTPRETSRRRRDPREKRLRGRETQGGRPEETLHPRAEA